MNQGGFGMDALWNDDFHHAALAALSGHNEAYYMDYNGSAQEFLSAAKWGYLYQGQRYKWQKRRRGFGRHGPAADGPWSTSCRTTTRSPTAAAGSASTWSPARASSRR